MTVERFSYLPPIRVSSEFNIRANGTSNAFGITMYQGDAAVLAQEVREFWIKWRLIHGPGTVALLIAFVGVATTGRLPWAIGFPIWIFSLFARRIAPFRRWLEFHGHEAEVQASRILYGQSEDAARERESGMRTSPSYDGIFDRMTHDEVIAAMAANRPAAARFVGRHRELLERFRRDYR